ncbi:ABC transporter permease [Paraburkholderia silvatlantica]|uniref:NitT/TauT family transport system permease protein n=1 Tax=Paraburkholderia silvatlantica TaxID=321895 RepID=A0A2U1AMV1_9BURK|nr:ABC transporter permease [Paraburkholderia silvatlantica]MBB2926658.1 NitT/TauT family transport system permease protein [Paraburkholderia silvatlantica]PVY37708.1 NitT/TauT family transport system permease protein [Paraburkholderia silvatlantica]PXW42671.1 NitT/TauT family transport system permease protein [Paraburkholderia silvatlantica]PYE14078.1 NitT/TauT family transport system permease protein [Paraburkholderia silvatlantica]TDR04909.1 NitT/TauT family transport system permease protei
MSATLDLTARQRSAATEPAPAAPAGRRSPTFRRALRIASIALFIAAWQLAVHYRLSLGVVTFANMPSPANTIPALWDLLHSPKLPMHLAASLTRVLVGFCAAAVVGVGLGLAIGRYRALEDILLPPLEMLRPIPAVAWIPLAILMFPSSELSMMFITFIGALFPILLNTIHGVEAVDPRLVATARGLGTGTLSLYTEVVLPGAAPSIFTGLSIGMGTAWFCLVTAEMIAGQYGIGYFTWESYTLQNYADIVVGMALIGVLGMGSSLLVKRVGNALTPWYRLRGARQ